MNFFVVSTAIGRLFLTNFGLFSTSIYNLKQTKQLLETANPSGRNYLLCFYQRPKFMMYNYVQISKSCFKKNKLSRTVFEFKVKI